MPSKFLNINTDNTLGGSSASDIAVPSQKAVKEYVDNNTAPAGSYATLDTLQTFTSGKKMFANDVNMAGNQTALLATISNSNTTTSDNAWVGRYICGAKNLTFLMGTYRTMAGIGAHSWSNAQTGAGAGWADFYLNPDGDKAVYIGGYGWTKNSGWLKVKNTGSNTGGTVQVNKGTVSSASWKDVAYKGENISDFTNNSGFITSASIGNATLKIQKNGTDVATFTANSSTDATANITVPTDTNDLTNGAGYITGITSSDVTSALGYTPYNGTNPSGYQANVIETVKVNGTALTPSNKAVDITVPTNNNQLSNGAGYITSSALNGYATEQWVGQQGYITGITSSDVTTALGYTPYNSSNPSGYQANVIETVKVNGSALTPSNKAVDITVPTVNNPTITITQGGVTKGSFTLNQSTGDSIELDAGGGNIDWTAIAGYDATKKQILVNDQGTVKWVTAGYIE